MLSFGCYLPEESVRGYQLTFFIPISAVSLVDNQHFFLFEIHFSLNVLCARYLSYGSGPKRFPLADVLQYAMEFASSKPVCTSPVEDIDTTAPPGGMTAQLPPPARQVFFFFSPLPTIQRGKYYLE